MITLKRKPISAVYEIERNELWYVKKLLDLGVLLASELLFAAHIHFIAGKQTLER